MIIKISITALNKIILTILQKLVLTWVKNKLRKYKVDIQSIILQPKKKIIYNNTVINVMYNHENYRQKISLDNSI